MLLSAARAEIVPEARAGATKAVSLLRGLA